MGLLIYIYIYIYTYIHMVLSRARRGAVVGGTALQAGRSQVRFPMASLEFFIDAILGSTQK